MKIIKKFFDIFYQNKLITFFLIGVLSTFNSPFLFLHNFENFSLYSVFIIYQYILPPIIFLISIFYIYKLNYLKDLISYKKYFILKLLFLLNLIQVFGVFFNNLDYFTPIHENSSQALPKVLLDWKSTYTRIIFIINNFNIILITFLCLKNKKLEFNLFFLIGFFLTLSFYYCLKILIDFTNIDYVINFYGTGVLQLGSSTLNYTNPRPTGLARIILLISIFFMMLYLFNKNKYIKKKIIRYIIFLLIIFLNFFVIHLQSRTSSYFLFLLPFFFLFFFYFYKTKNFFFIITLLIIIPFLLSQLTFFYKLNLVEKRIRTDNSQNELIISQQINNYIKAGNRVIYNNTTSGRIETWSQILKSYNEIPILGYGVLGDKFAYSVSASNIFLYFLVSAGVVGFLTILLFNFYILKNIFYLLISRKIFRTNNAIFYISFFFVVFFLFRSLFENSYGQFGIDFIFFVPSYLIFESYLKKFKII